MVTKSHGPPSMDVMRMVSGVLRRGYTLAYSKCNSRFLPLEVITRMGGSLNSLKGGYKGDYIGAT